MFTNIFLAAVVLLVLFAVVPFFQLTFYSCYLDLEKIEYFNS